MEITRTSSNKFSVIHKGKILKSDIVVVKETNEYIYLYTNFSPTGPTAFFRVLNKKNNTATFEEIFKDDKTKHIRQNIHKMYMPTQKHILSIAKENGFILLGKIDMVPVQYEYQYLYILQKPE